MSDIAAVQDWRDAEIAAAQQRVIDVNMRMDVMQRELAEVVRERDALIDLLRESLTVLDALKFHAFAFETRFHARQACPSYGDDDASQV